MAALTFLTQAATMQLHNLALQWTLVLILASVIRLGNYCWFAFTEEKLSKQLTEDVVAHTLR